MKEYIREIDNFDFFPFTLVSRLDHVTPITSVPVGLYLISLNAEPFVLGKGGSIYVGQGCYKLLLDKSEHVSGTALVYIPASTGNPGYDAVYFRVIRTQANEIVPVNQRTVYNLIYAMVSSMDHVSLLPNIITTVMVSRDGSPFVSPGTFPLSLGFGFYVIEIPVFAQVPHSDFNNECVYTIKATGNGADVTYDSFQVFRYKDPA